MQNEKELGISGYDSIEEFKNHNVSHIPQTEINPVNERIHQILSGLMDLVFMARTEAKQTGDKSKLETINWKLKNLGFVIEDDARGMKWTLK